MRRSVLQLCVPLSRVRKEHFPGSDPVIVLSGAGLIYHHFGRDLIHRTYPELSTADLEWVYQTHYTNFVKAVDAIDNGISATVLPDGTTDGLVTRYVNSTHLNARISALMPQWNGPSSVTFDSQFLLAVQLAGEEFSQHLDRLVKHGLPARQIAEQAMARRREYFPSGSVLVVEQYAPILEYVPEFEEEAGQVLFVVMPNSARSDWRIRAMPVEIGRFELRKSLPAAWCGIRDTELQALTGTTTANFVHKAGFTGGAKTREDALIMAKLAISL
eukprot:gnl/Dysnectes_brevis/1774_a2030_2712.p1 GENE.gnl/Dysnectes_brevis/1774_a2030_2712~~gnl/Dysnectes_brevis/1774_a2030_2712.p1  ORF type:complete len:273 (+),score=54.17 gnl/Dysnectes_brevis/1774_a2030_2712:201-1019(+)